MLEIHRASLKRNRVDGYGEVRVTLLYNPATLHQWSMGPINSSNVNEMWWFLQCILPALKLYLIGVKALLYQLFNNPLALPVLPAQNGKVAIVTGGARGMGYETVRHLTRLGMHVIIASNHDNEGLTAVKRICEERNDAQVEFEHLDLASLRSVRQFVKRFKHRGLPLHVLVNNAAVMLVPETKTEEGFEQHFGINYLGHFLLTSLLLDTLKQSGQHDSYSRIVTISSSAHHMGQLSLKEAERRHSYSPHAAYAHSKLALVLFTYRLQQELTAGGFPVTANVVDPGMVDTALYRHLCSPAQLAKKLVARLLFWTAAQGASTAIFAATAAELEGVGGCYLHNGRRARSAAASYDEALQAHLWTQSCRLAGLLPEPCRAD
ncbi:dehydrogenase/reductase SDR family member on chromosome X-like isoform X1 [Alosa sapidissima]|uniref:dehydrogenase/reductase SDR family member on chromosome X-like isoform X1 n=1 Tax=Alosa sapidissima TaxID=34773 RepID=UPI001C083951|nr:dehydrogenase/reductase SDR family member on chromosome X-like isoform X1 [Alosa sapidissima]